MSNKKFTVVRDKFFKRKTIVKRSKKRENATQMQHKIKKAPENQGLKSH